MLLCVAAALFAEHGGSKDKSLIPSNDPGRISETLVGSALPTTTCAPPMGKVSKTLSIVDHSLPRAPFFLHEEGVFNLSDVLTCLHESFNVTKGEDGFDSLPPDIDMHLTDMWLIDRMRSHPLRVHDFSKAKLHVIGAPLASAWRTVTTVQTFLYSNKCGTWETHKERANAIADKLKGMEAFQESKGRNFLLLNSYYFTEDSVGQELLSLLTSGPAIFTVAEHCFKQSLPGGPLAKINPIVLPYKASALAESMAFEEPLKGTPPRPIQFMFHGDMKRKCKPVQAAEGCKRDLLLQLDEELHRSPALATSIHDYSFEHLLKKYAYGSAYDPSPFLKVVNFTHNKQSRSRFCLIPSGDTPTSRRLYDALASGCIPVVMAEFDTYAINLPFQRTIDWRRLLFFAGSLPCLKNHADATAEYLRGIAKLDVSAVRKAGRNAFRDTLSYTRGAGLVDALLREATAKLDETDVQSEHAGKTTSQWAQKHGGNNGYTGHHSEKMSSVPITIGAELTETRPLDAAQPNIAALQGADDAYMQPHGTPACRPCAASLQPCAPSLSTYVRSTSWTFPWTEPAPSATSARATSGSLCWQHAAPVRTLCSRRSTLSPTSTSPAIARRRCTRPWSCSTRLSAASWPTRRSTSRTSCVSCSAGSSPN
jgi:hypothetical protein